MSFADTHDLFIFQQCIQIPLQLALSKTSTFPCFDGLSGSESDGQKREQFVLLYGLRFESVEREGAFALGQEKDQLGSVAEEFLGKEDEEAEIVVTAIEDIG